MKRIAPALAFALAAVAAPAQAAPRQAAVETIAYETGPCFGRCPVYQVTVFSNGRAIFELASGAYEFKSILTQPQPDAITLGGF